MRMVNIHETKTHLFRPVVDERRRSPVVILGDDGLGDDGGILGAPAKAAR